jgi:CRISPR-associated protein Csb2
MSDASHDDPTVARYKLVADDPPPLTDAVVVGDAFRAALMSRSDGAPVFAGKDASGEPLEGHVHNHVIVESLSDDGAISHMTLYAPMGFDEAAQSVLRGLDRVWNNGEVQFTLQTLLLGMGRPRDFGGRRRQAGHALALAEARVWESQTPFVPTRHAKDETDQRGLRIGSPEHDVYRLLEVSEHPEPEDVVGGWDAGEGPQETELGGESVEWSAFRTVRTSGGGRRSTRNGYGFRLEFPEPVRGPICLGYGAHYGLGRFEPVEGET